MLNCINLQNNGLIASPTDAGQIRDVDGTAGRISTKRGTNTPLDGQFLDRPFASTNVDLGDSLELRFGCKEEGKEDGPYVVSNYNASTGLFEFEKRTTDAGPIYTVKPGWSTTKLNWLLGYDPYGFAEETLVETEPDVAGSLDGKTFILHDHASSVGVWLAIDDGATPTPAPAAACGRQFRIGTVNTGDAADVVATKIKTALAADTQFSGTISNNNFVTVVDATVGPRTAAADVDTGFTITRWIPGSAPNTLTNQPYVDLLGEWYWNQNGVVSKSQTITVRVYFAINNANEGISADATPAYPAPGRIVLLDTEQTITAAKHFTGPVDGLKTSGMTYQRTDTGTVARSLQEILDSGYATPEDFGAVGDGTTNDSVAIQDAVNTALTVAFGAKTYRISSAIAFHAGQQFAGQGIGRTTILLDDGIDGFTTSENFTAFRDMTIRGNSSSHLGGRGIALGNNVSPTGNTCNVESIEFKFCAVGFYNGYYDGVSLRNCVLHSNTVNLKAENNVGPMGVTDCIINDATGDGILAVSANIKMRGGNLNSNGMSGTGYAIRATGSGSNVVADAVQFEVVANGTPGAAYCYVDFNNGLTITNSIWQDGGIGFVHVVCFNGCLIRLQGNSVANNPNTTAGPILNGSGVFDARSADFNGYVSYGSIHYRLCPWRTYNDGWTLPTASASSEDIYAVASSTGSGSQRLFAKREVGGAYSYVGIDGTAAGLDVDTDGTLAANSDTRLASQKATKTYVDAAKEVFGAVQSTTINMWSSGGGSAWIDGAFHDVPDLQIANVPVGNYFIEVDIWYGMDPSNTGIKWQLAGSATFTGGDYFERIAPQEGTTMLTTNIVSGDSIAGNGASTHILRYRGVLNVTVAGTIKLQIGTPTAGDSGQFQKGSNLELRRF